MAWIRTPFFFLFGFSFSLMPLAIEKKGVEQKQKQKQKQKQSGPLFFGLDVFFGVWLSLSFFHSKLAFFFSIFMANGS
jgi:hypothetical protein